MRIKRPSIASSPAIKRRRYENVVTSQSSPAIFPVCLLAAGVEDSESCRDRCHAWYLMSTCVRALGPRAHAIPVLLYTSTLAALTTCAPNRFPLPPPPPHRSLSAPADLPFRSLLRGVRGHIDTAPASLLRSVQGERDAVKIQPSFLKRVRSIVRSFSKGSRGIACPKPFISVSAEVRPSRLARKRERSAVSIRSRVDIMKRRPLLENWLTFQFRAFDARNARSLALERREIAN